MIRKISALKYKKALKTILQGRNGGGKLVAKIAKKADKAIPSTAMLIKAGDDKEIFCNDLDELYDYSDIKNGVKYGELDGALGDEF
jgi:hypothetical protein